MVDTPKNVAYYPQSASVDELRIFASTGEFDVTKLLIELSFFEDMYSFVISGYVILRDGIGLVEKLQLSGKEEIQISFGSTKGGSENVNKLLGNLKKYRIYSIPDRKPVGNQNSEFIKIFFCSKELFDSEQIKVVKSYKGKAIHQIITDILLTQLKVNPNRIDTQNFEKTIGVYDFIIPTLRPFEAISWLCTYAKPAKTGGQSADMLFFETKDGFQFRSISSIYKDRPYKTYTYNIKNIESQTFEQKITSVLDYQFVKDFDALNEINSGTFINRVMSFDPLNRSTNFTDFDYTKDITTRLNKGAPTDISEYKDKARGALKLVVSNSNQKFKPTFQNLKQPSQKNLSPDSFIQETVKNRTAELALANYTILKIRVPGDTGLTAGSIINFNLPALDYQNNRKQFDKFYSGKYLVTAVRHILQSQGVFQTDLEITKDSSGASYIDLRK
jgi:hypothetical protein